MTNKIITTPRLITTGSLLVLCLLFQNCKKPAFKVEDPESYAHVFMPLASNGAITKALPIKDEWISSSLGVGYGGPAELSQAIDITLEIDPASIATYNEQNNTSYELPPAGSYRLSGDQVQIASGKNGSNSVSLDINPLKLGGTRAYLVPVSIKTVSSTLTVAAGLKTTYFIVNGFYETNPFAPYPISDWKIHDYSDDDYDAIGGRAPYCIDGDVNTCWLSTYRRVNGWRPGHPHYVTIDMQKSQVLHGIKLYGRRGASNAYLFPKTVQIETSEDAVTWSTAGIFTIAASSDETAATMYLEKSVAGRYMKVTVLSSATGGETTAVAEIEAF
ncbi:BT_3987 domain-containing protein [Niabella drilacis]|uniref:F5/8 type C domain-containing protein n=1 Tax=Niabella drilacis (strain DSM 25811 / CCM 8410 / CCUG 62505 / LMG 26954 / E90) TaxID=1285928 RepID=A0A1G6T8A7_NIADE|nr:DUF1735 domain-containing protein [Niabella drilacis]SDD25340.1 F5/8 type C domain-containing protein [Niabella drilacis]